MSRVDIIVPCYNYAKHLSACVGSVLTQSHGDLRVLIIDDCSTDHSADVATQLVSQDRRVEFLRHTVNHGHIATYNEGLAWSTGDYTLLLSADDLLTPGALRRVVRLMDAHPDVGLAYGRQVVFNTEPPALPAHAIPYEGTWRVIPGSELIENCCAVGANPVPTPTAVLRTALLKALGGYRADLPHTADLEMWLRFAAHAPVGVLEADQAYKRLHAHNMQHGFLTAPVGDLRQRMAAFEVFFRDQGRRVAGAEGLERAATRSIAGEAFWGASAAFDRGDLIRCRECLSFALELDPDLKSRPEWFRFSLKRCIGPRLWGGMLSAVSRWRKLEAVSPGLFSSTGGPTR
jgi:glycosyltransferase involved in cell wall biosynthesis